MKRARAVFLLLAACQSPPHGVKNRCAPDWPAPPTPAAPAAPIAGATPKILWRTPITLGPANDWLLVTSDRVAFTGGGRLYLFDKTGAYLGGRSSTGFEGVSSAVVDDAGNYYMVGQNVYSVDKDGNMRWQTPLAGKQGQTPGAGRSSALSPDGTLIIGASDGALYGVSTTDGHTIWRTEVSGDGENQPVVKGGIGGAVIAVVRGKDATRPGLFDAKTGAPLQWWSSSAGDRFGVLAAPSLGIVTQRMEDKGGHYPWMHIAVLDQCGREKWTLPATRPQWPSLVGPGDRLYVVERDDIEQSQTFVSVYAPDGTREQGPVAAAAPWAIGADGTVYGMQCDTPGTEGPSRLIAYDASLKESWRLELGPSCPFVGPVIDSDGVMYFTWQVDGVTELVAVQTQSPGLADGAWSVRGHDARGTKWVK